MNDLTEEQERLYEMAQTAHKRMASRPEAFHVVGEDIEINHEPMTEVVQIVQIENENVSGDESEGEIPTADTLFGLLVCIFGLIFFTGLIGYAAYLGLFH